jgi:hypothetical protein
MNPDERGQTVPMPQNQLPQNTTVANPRPAIQPVNKQQAIQLIGNPPQPPTGLDVIEPQQLAPDAEKQLLDVVGGNLRRMLYFRRNYDQPRSGFYKQYVSQRDATLFPDGKTRRSNTFVPYAYSNVETIVSRTLDALFSLENWFDCKGRGPNDEPAAEAMTLVLQHKLHKANAIKHIEDLIRNITIYGHAAIKVDWDWDYDLVTYAEPIVAVTQGPEGQPVAIPNPMTGQPIIAGYRPNKKQVPRARPS